jgi:prepilin-type N-terminal cleavage/methylation domain-containing protein
VLVGRCLIEGQGVRHRTTLRSPIAPRRGVTLLELIVVIALLGLILAIVAPAFIVPSPKRESELATALATARRAAILRGEPVTLAFRDEVWEIDGDAMPAAAPIATGRLGASVGSFRVHVSPMGTCVTAAVGPSNSAEWNALDCRFSRETAERAPR